MSGGERAGRIEIREVAGPGRRGKEERREAMNVLILCKEDGVDRHTKSGLAGES